MSPAVRKKKVASPASPSWEDKSRLRAIPNSARGQGHRPYCVVFLPGILGLPSNFHSPWCCDSQIPVTYGETKAQVLSQGLPHVPCPVSFLTLRPQLEVVPTLFSPSLKPTLTYPLRLISALACTSPLHLFSCCLLWDIHRFLWRHKAHKVDCDNLEKTQNYK